MKKYLSYDGLQNYDTNIKEFINDINKDNIKLTGQTLNKDQQSQARANINAQEKLVGVAGQVVGFDANGNAVAQEAPGGGGGATWAGLPDKPVVMVGKPDTLTWDGNTEGKEDIEGVLFKVSNAVPSLEDLANGYTVQLSTGEVITNNDIPVEEDGFMIRIGGEFAIIVTEDGEFTKGVYLINAEGMYCSSITIPGYTGFAHEKIAPSHLWQPDWNQKDSTQPDYVKNRTHYEIGRTMREIMPATEITPMDDGSGSYIAELDVSMFTAKEKQIAVTFDGVEYVCDCLNEDGAMAFGNLATLGESIESSEPFACVVVPMYEMCVMAFIDDLTHTVSMSEVNIEYKKLADGYINSEWLAQRAPSSYDICIDSSITFKSDESSINIPINVFPSHGGRITDLEVTWNGTYYKCPCQRFGLSFNNYAYFTGFNLISGSLTGKYPFGIIIQKGRMDIFVPEENAGSTNIISVRAITSYVLSPLDSDFLPETLLHYEDQNLEESQKNTARYNIGAQAKLTGKAGQVVGFDENGNAIAQEVPTDDTLSIAGAAADAKAVGDAMDSFDENMFMVASATALSIPGALQWNGIIGDREYITIEELEGTVMAIVHITDEVPTILEGAPVTVGMGQIAEGVMQIAQPVTLVEQIPGLYMADEFLMIATQPVDLGGIVLPKAGVYGIAMSYLPSGMDVSMMWVSSLYIPGYEFASEGASKYFEKQTITTEVGDTLTWDGNTEGYYTGKEEYTFPSGNLIIEYVLVSNSTPSVEELQANEVTIVGLNCIDGTSETLYNPSPLISTDGASAILRDVVSIVYSPTKDFTKTGTYFLYSKLVNADGEVTQSARPTSFTISGYNFTAIQTSDIIKTEHLPEALRFGEMPTIIGGDTLTWDGNTDGLHSVNTNPENETYYYKISDATPTETELAAGTIVMSAGNSGSSAILVAQDEGALIGTEGIYIVIPYDNYSFPLGSDLTVVFAKKGIYTCILSNGNYMASLTIPGYTGFETKSTKIVTIDPKYLPEGYGSGSGGGTVSSISASKVTAGTFAGQVVANSTYQSPTTSLLRNSKLVSTDTNPTVNGEIYWIYE